MGTRQGVVLAVLWLGACAGRPAVDEASRPIDRVVVESSSVLEGGFCHRCQMDVFEGHRCGITVPCALCKREQGVRHLHEVQWTCPVDETVMSRQHLCNDAKTCDICREDKRTLLGSIACERCYRQVPPTGVYGITAYCAECEREVGANHIHGKTAYCLSCLREAGANHKCDATRLCMEHAVEHAPDHEHGITAYCARCHRDAGPDHRHGITEWCWRCYSEKEWPHSHHDD